MKDFAALRGFVVGVMLCSSLLYAQKSPPGSLEQLTLKSKIFGNTRTIRVWLPPRYHEASQHSRKYPVFYFTDGVAAFHGRQLDRVASELISSGQIPPAIFVGIDNGGSTRESRNPGSDRANEYLPYPDEFLSPPVPHPQGQKFPMFLEQEVRSLVESRYRVNGDLGLAGSSYGAAIVLYTAMENPDRYKWLLLESPSLYIADDALLKRAETVRAWPSRVYIGAGTNEGEGDAKQEMVTDVHRLAHSLQNRTATCVVIAPWADHSEQAWRARLPMALRFLLGREDCGNLQVTGSH